MKRSSSEAVDDNAWNEVLQEPSKKAKSEDVVLQIDPAEFASETPAASLNEKDGDISHTNGGHQNGHNNGNGQQNGHAKDGHQNGHNGDAKDGHYAKGTDANCEIKEEDLQSGYVDYENGAAVELGSLDPLFDVELSEVEVPLKSEEPVELSLNKGTEDVPDCGNQNLESEEPQQNLEQGDETEEEPMELKFTEEVEKDDELQEGKSETTASEALTWNHQKLRTSELCGHAYKINAIDMAGSTLVSASDDTTVKAWDTATKKEICTLSGHKEAVTAVKILDLASSKEICKDGGNVVISGSKDCCAKFWHIPTGKELNSIYTFNAITCVGYICNDALLVTATEGGKLELFDAVSGKNLSSVLAFELPVVSMKVCGDMIICGDPQCRLQVWVVKDKKLCCRRSSNGMETSRPILSGIDFYGTENVIAGLFSGSVKKMSWINGSVVKLRHGDGDQVDALQVQDELMVVTTSKEDNFLLNFYELPTGTYLGSVPGTEVMSSVTAARIGGQWTFATGGDKLKWWQSVSLQDECENSFEFSMLPQAEKTLVDTSDSEDEEAEEESSGIMSNCCVM